MLCYVCQENDVIETGHSGPNMQSQYDYTKILYCSIKNVRHINDPQVQSSRWCN